MDSSSRALLYDTAHLNDFIAYYQLRLSRQQSFRSQEKQEILSIGALRRILDRFTEDDFAFSSPKLIRINKMRSNKMREVFVFSHDEQIILKYINFVLSDGRIQMHPQCFSFQRGRSIKEALHYIKRVQMQGMACIKLDITNYFNSIPIDNDNAWLRRELSAYPDLTNKIQGLLSNQTVVDEGRFVKKEQKGVMAGMPLSPFLSNLYLKAFDAKMSDAFAVYARYSDDMIFFCDEERVQVSYEQIVSVLKSYGLMVNPEKTKVFKPNEGFEFLGLSICGNTVDLSQATVEKMKQKIKRAAKSLYRWQQAKFVPYEKTVMVLIRKFNRKLYGWKAAPSEFSWSKWFCSLLTQTDGLREIDAYFQETARYLATGKYSKRNYQMIPYSMLKQYGYEPLVAHYYKHYRRCSKGA